MKIGDGNKEKVWFLGRNHTIPVNTEVPERLVEIQQAWSEKCDKFSNTKTACASINFKYQGIQYEMAPPCDNRFLWESTLPDIKEMLREAGAIDIQYMLVLIND